MYTLDVDGCSAHSTVYCIPYTDSVCSLCSLHWDWYNDSKGFDWKKTNQYEIVLSAKCYWYLECLEPEMFWRKDAVRRKKCRSWTINPSALIISNVQLFRPKFRNLCHISVCTKNIHFSNHNAVTLKVILFFVFKQFSASADEFAVKMANKWFIHTLAADHRPYGEAAVYVQMTLARMLLLFHFQFLMHFWPRLV